jgi:putative oxidoreductase
MQNSTSYNEWMLVPLRLMIGFGFAAHGYAKLSRGPESLGDVLQTIGIPQPHFVAWVTALTEFIGGISLMAGAFVAPFSLPLAVIMITAMLKVHLQYGFSSVRLKGITAAGAEFGPIGYEMNLLYITGLLTLTLSRPTKLSLDHWLRTRKRAPKKPMNVS